MARICVYGAGAIGCYLGGRLLAAGADLGFVGRPRSADELAEHGLTLTDLDGGQWRIPATGIAVATGPEGAATADLVLVTVKSAATGTVAAELAQVLRPGAVVVSFQNGLGHAETLRAALPGRTVLAGMVPFNVVSPGPGVFHQASAGGLVVAEDAALAPFLPAFASAGLPLEQHRDMLPVQWAKLLLNLNNAVNALANRPLREELSLRAYRRCLALAQAEALALLDETGLRPARLTPLPARWIPRLLDTPDWLFARLAARMLAIDPTARSSMSDDLAAGRTSEIDWINGEIVRLATRHGRTAPVNARLVALIHAAEASAERPSWTGAALLAELEAARLFPEGDSGVTARLAS
ncbi:2-dehydropantoate 2-reductase [Bosea sp. LjRoot9]|uniref:2-dehydropantoate 2-reductase n=1 Tax=Bosea sp. LjRoot9 TaxID=3342341 RepID=UPI003ED159BD